MRFAEPSALYCTTRQSQPNATDTHTKLPSSPSETHCSCSNTNTASQINRLNFQFANPANPQKHYETTGREIWEQTQGAVDLCCFGVGSGGTVTGVGRYLKERKPSVKIYAVEPVEAAVINGKPHAPHKIPGG